MSTIHQRQASHAAHADVPQEGHVTSGQVTFNVEPSTAHDREEQEIHETLQQCQGMIGAHEITPWRSQITVRSIVLGALYGAVFSIIVHKLNLTTGVIPSLGMSIALINFFTVKLWNGVLCKLNFDTLPFSPQENAIMQTCVGSVAGLAFTGGFGSYLIGMDQQSYENVGNVAGNNSWDVYNPELWRVIPYLLCISLIGIFILLSLRKRFVIQYNLPFPSSTASGVLINSLHSIGNRTAVRQMSMLLWTGGGSFFWSMFKWFFSASGTTCNGWDKFPTFGLKALEWTWQFDWSATYIGVGMICPHIVNASMMLGSILTWGILWPYIDGKAGVWYPMGLKEHDFKGLFGYKVFLAISVFLGDGLYHFTKIAIISLWSIKKSMDKKDDKLPVAASPASPATPVKPVPVMEPHLDGEGAHLQGSDVPATAADGSPPAPSHRQVELLNSLRDRVFLHEGIPGWVGAIGYAICAVIGCATIPHLYKAVKWFMVAVVFLSSPVFSVANAYGAGLTDWDQSSLYGKLCIFAFAAWGGQDGGVIAGLAVCGIMLSVTSAACGLMGDFRTAHITLCNPRSMFVAQVIGSAMGCVIAPLTFLMFYKAFPLGVPGTAYPAPYATIYRAMAILGVEGISALPQHCIQMCIGFFFVSVLIALLRDVLPKKYAAFVPIPMAAAIPFYIGAQLAIDMCIGSVIKAVWNRWKPKESEAFVPVAASGLIAGDGLWTVPAALLAIGHVNPPICMSFSGAS